MASEKLIPQDHKAIWQTPSFHWWTSWGRTRWSDLSRASQRARRRLRLGTYGSQIPIQKPQETEWNSLSYLEKKSILTTQTHFSSRLAAIVGTLSASTAGRWLHTLSHGRAFSVSIGKEADMQNTTHVQRKTRPWMSHMNSVSGFREPSSLDQPYHLTWWPSPQPQNSRFASGMMSSASLIPEHCQSCLWKVSVLSGK